MKYKGFTAAVSWVCIYYCSWLEGLIKIMGFLTSLPLFSVRWKCNKLDWRMSSLCAGSHRSVQIWWQRGQGAAGEDKANSSHLVLWIWMAGSPFPHSHSLAPISMQMGVWLPQLALMEKGSVKCSYESRESGGTAAGGPFPAIAQMHDEVICIWSRQTEARCLETALQRVFLLVLLRSGSCVESAQPFLFRMWLGLAIPCVCAGAQRAARDIPWCSQLPWNGGKASAALKTLSSPWIQHIKHRMRKAERNTVNLCIPPKTLCECVCFSPKMSQEKGRW